MLLQLRQEAADELEAAVHWYQSQDHPLGQQFLKEVWLTFQRIRTNPEGYPAGYRGTPRALIHRFPYGVIYL